MSIDPTATRAEEGVAHCGHCGAVLTAEEAEFYGNGCERCESELHAAMQEERAPILPPPNDEVADLRARAATAEAELERLRIYLAQVEIAYERGVEHRNDLSDAIVLRRTERDAAKASASALRERVAVLEEALNGWKRVAVIAAIPLEAMRASGSYRSLAPSTQSCVDEAVVTIRMAVSGHGLPPEGDIDVGLEPARAALANRPEAQETDHG